MLSFTTNRDLCVNQMRLSLAAAVVERLRERILSGELQEGEQLRQEAIATEFDISRIPVREALSHLAG